MMVHIKKLCLIIVLFFFFRNGYSQFIISNVGNWEVAYYIGTRKSKSIKFMSGYNSPASIDRYYTHFYSEVLDVKELEDSLVLSIANSHSENIMTYQINNSLVDSSLCIYQNPFWEIPLNDSTNLEYGYHPLYGVCGYFIKYRKFRVIINSSCDRCTYEYHFQNNRNRYYIVLMHNDYELVNIIRLKRKR